MIDCGGSVNVLNLRTVEEGYKDVGGQDRMKAALLGRS